MVYLVLVQLLSLILATPGWAKLDRIHAEAYLGEKRLDSYANRRKPLVVQDFYRGKLSFQDDIFYQNYFTPYIFPRETEFTGFLKSELIGSLACTNEQLSEHYDDIRYAYRLITLSYLLEGQWHMKMLSNHLGLSKSCKFDLQSFLSRCRPIIRALRKLFLRPTSNLTGGGILTVVIISTTHTIAWTWPAGENAPRSNSTGTFIKSVLRMRSS
jgi:hypothetical protein